MAHDNKSNPIAQYGPVGAPVLGVVLAIAFIATAFATSTVGAKKEELKTKQDALLAKLNSDKITKPVGDFPLADGAQTALQPGNANDWKAPPATNRMLAHPVLWKVTMQDAELDLFDQWDEDKDGYWSPQEFDRTDFKFDPDPLKANFDNWDRNPKDGQICRNEFDDPPESDTAKFQRLDENGDGVLTSEAGEITDKEEFDWDRYPYDGEIDESEYARRYEPREERDLGPVSNVQVAVDPENMEVVVTWDDPTVDALPEDIAFSIWRRAPETVEERQKAYRKKIGEYDDEYRAWDKQNFDPWWKQLTSEWKSANNIRVRTQALELFKEITFDKWWGSATPGYRKDLGIEEEDAAAARVKGEEVFNDLDRNPPRKPQPPTEWEPVTTEAPVTGNEYRDTTFDLNVTYTYAVQMTTQKPPKRGQVADTEQFDGWFTYPERTATKGHPVRVQNNINIIYKAAGSGEVTLTLKTWYRYQDKWHLASVDVNAATDEQVGGEYTAADLRGLSNPRLGDNLNLVEILETGETINFDTGYTFVAKAGNEVILDSRTGPGMALPAYREADMGPSSSPVGMENPVEVRLSGLGSRGRDGTFELTRWHKVQDQWVRVVVTRKVDSGDEVGTSVDLGKAGEGVMVFNSSGDEISSSDLKDWAGEMVDMTVGTFDGVEKRTLSIGGEGVDLFNTLYVDK